MATLTETLARTTPDLAQCVSNLWARKQQLVPLSTYRLQFHKHFKFVDATKIAGYLHTLGITHVYSSPILEARPGSNHGYDIINHDRLNPEIGTEAEFREFVSSLREHGMGIILDIVSNHMGVGSRTLWWRDVLENGRTSKYAEYFDIDWHPLKPEMRDKLLLPILGDQYGVELEQGKIRICLSEDNLPVVVYCDNDFPLDPQTWSILFAEALGSRRPQSYVWDRWRTLIGELSSLPKHSSDLRPEADWRNQRLPELKQEFAALLRDSEETKQFVEAVLQQANGRPGEAKSFDALHSLLEAQVFRLAYWRVSGEEINYRRFFDVNDLVGLSMENPRVFADTHKYLRKLLAEDSIQGVRIDHCDGMLNPRQYLIRMQMLYAASQCCGKEPVPPLAENGIEEELQQIFGALHGEQHANLYTVVEKILELGEELPLEWPVDGTSGYDFTNLVNGIFIQKKNEKPFTTIYLRFTEGFVDPRMLVYSSKKLIMHSALSSEVNVLTHLLGEISSADRRVRDFTHNTVRDAIRETIACFPVYRTYIDERGEYTECDIEHVNLAINRAKRLNADTSESVFDFLHDTLLLKGGRENEELYRKRLYFVLKFQQLTGPVMAKGLEDTVCYIYNRFVSVNEVGGSPAEFGIRVEEFHKRNLARAARWPRSMLATSTHDSKRSEDVRARLDVLSEMPQVWSANIFRWRSLNANKKRTISDGRIVPDCNEEYLLYQSLLGIWPEKATNEELASLTQRLQQYMTKAVHEAKVNLSWINQNPEYLAALQAFIAEILSPTQRGRPNRFLRELNNFVPAVSLFGAMNSLAQTVLKITSPGNPDIYQGTELWDFSLVDPDNRRPVNFAIRQRCVAELRARATRNSGSSLADLCAELLATYPDGRVKLWTTMQVMRFRRENAQLFASGSYLPLSGTADIDENICSFARQIQETTVLVAVPRFAYTLMRGRLQFPLGEAWGGSEIQLPQSAAKEFHNIFTDETLTATSQRRLLCREVFARFPVAVLTGNL